MCGKRGKLVSFAAGVNSSLDLLEQLCYIGLGKLVSDDRLMKEE
jgi:hypothetical protein